MSTVAKKPSKETVKEDLQETSFKESLAAYFKGVKSEWGKITWPEKPQVVRETIAVLVVVFFFVLLVSFYDWIFGLTLGLLAK